METGRKRRVRDAEGGGWSRGEGAGVKSGTRLVPAFHSHWPCRSLYRCSSSSSSFFFFFSSSTSSSSAPYSYSFPPAEKEKGRRGIPLDRLPPRISPSFPPLLRHFTSAACSTSTGSGHFEGPRDEDIPRARFAKLPIFDGPSSFSCQRTHLRIISTLSRGIRPCAHLSILLGLLSSSSDDSLFLSPFSLSFCLSRASHTSHFAK